MRTAVFAFVILSALGFGQICRADAWGQAGQTLRSWQGEREASLLVALDDPFSDLAIQKLVELLLETGYVIIPPPSATVAGLTLDLKPSASGWFLTISRNVDDAVIGMGRYSVEKPEEAAKVSEATRVFSQEAAKPTPAVKRTLKVEGSPWGIAGLNMTKEGDAVVALIYDDKLEVVRLKESGLEIVAAFESPINPGRAIWIDSGDINDDGVIEIAATWAEDVYSIDEGVNSTLHAWVFEYSNERLLVKSDDLEGFARILGGRGHVQKRGEYSLHRGPVNSFVQSTEGKIQRAKAISWPSKFLFDATPLDDDEFLIWGEGSRLGIAAARPDTAVNERLFFDDLGKPARPTIAVRLEEPIYRSGFSPEDRVLEDHRTLPQRIVTSSPKRAYTIRHKRKKNIPIFGFGDSGQDSLVLIVKNNAGLALERVIQSVEAFVVDFAIASVPGKTVALTLVKFKSLDSGDTFLAVTEVN